MKHSLFIKFTLYLTLFIKITILVLPTLTVEPIGWIEPFYKSALYIAIGVFLLCVDSLIPEYHIDILSLIFFILVGTLFRTIELEFNTIYAIFRMTEWIVAGALFIRIVNKKIPLDPLKWKHIVWTLVSLIIGISLSIPTAYLIVNTPGFQTSPVDIHLYTSPIFIVRLLVFNSISVVIEEITFRGFLFGYLIKYYDNNVTKALLLQSLIFWLLHFDTIWSYPLGFWVAIPVSTLTFGLLVRRSHALSSSIIAHMFFNTFVTIFSIVFANS